MNTHTLLEPLFLWSFVERSGGAASRRQGDDNALDIRRVANAKIGTALRFGLNDDLLAGRGRLQLEIHNQIAAVGFDTAKKRIFLDLAVGQRRYAESRRCGLDRKVQTKAGRRSPQRLVGIGNGLRSDPVKVSG